MISRDDLRRIAEQLLVIAGDDETADPDRDGRANGESLIHTDPDVLARLAVAMYRARQARSRNLPSNLFGEPAWDILLDLFIAKSRGRRVSVTSVCIASQVPATTALRWIGLLQSEGIIVRDNDNDDRRRAFLRLSESGEKAVARCLIEASKALLPIRKTVSLFSEWGT